jgi:hypothetical protein
MTRSSRLALVVLVTLLVFTSYAIACEQWCRDCLCMITTDNKCRHWKFANTATPTFRGFSRIYTLVTGNLGYTTDTGKTLDVYSNTCTYTCPPSELQQEGSSMVHHANWTRLIPLTTIDQKQCPCN